MTSGAPPGQLIHQAAGECPCAGRHQGAQERGLPEASLKRTAQHYHRHDSWRSDTSDPAVPSGNQQGVQQAQVQGFVHGVGARPDQGPGQRQDVVAKQGAGGDVGGFVAGGDSPVLQGVRAHPQPGRQRGPRVMPAYPRPQLARELLADQRKV